jgi:hypothetical protein
MRDVLIVAIFLGIPVGSAMIICFVEDRLRMRRFHKTAQRQAKSRAGEGEK